jgi:hypothetical protein
VKSAGRVLQQPAGPEESYMKDTPSAAQRRDQSARIARQGKAPLAIERIGKLAVLLRQAEHTIAELEDVIGDIWPIDPRFGLESITGDELREDIIAWSYEIKRAQDVLYSNFIPDVVAALKAANLEDEHDTDDEDDDEGEDSDEDAPTVADVQPVPAEAAELPPARTRPYWLS